MDYVKIVVMMGVLPFAALLLLLFFKDWSIFAGLLCILAMFAIEASMEGGSE